MIGPEERLMALGVPAALAREMVILFSQGGGGTPLLAANNLSDLTNTTAARTNLGLGAFAQRDNVAVASSVTISLSGDGAGTPLTGQVAVSAEAGNALTAEADGLYVPPSAGGVPEAPDDGEVYGRGSEAWQQLSAVAASGAYTDLTGRPTLATVATSGSYDDLDDKPTIPPAQVNSDWDASSGVAEILNKPTIPAAQVNADWNASTGVAEILNKPALTPYPGTGIPVSTGTAWDTSKDAPTGDLVGTTDAQTISAKTLGQGTKELVEIAGDLNVNVNSAPFLQVELSANASIFPNLPIGVSRSLWLNPSTYTVTIPSGLTQVNFPDTGLPASKWSLITLTGKPDSTDGIAVFVMSLP